MAKAYSYTRFSTPEQAKGDSQRRQVELAEAYAATHGLELDEDLRLRDEGVSGFRGANVRKGALGQFLSAIDDGIVEPGSLLLVESLDRVSRQNPWEALPIFQQILNAGITIVTLFDGKTYSEADMKANPFRILESLFVMVRANEESETKARRLKAAWTGKRKLALQKPLTSLVPAWMEKVGQEIKLIPERAGVVRRVVDMTLGGTGQHRIAETLNREGVPVFGDGQKWHRSYISKILENPALVGTLVPHEMVYVDGKRERRPLDPVHGYYPAVVSEEEWAKLATMADGRKPKVKGEAKLQNILSGLAKCQHCGASMVRVHKGKKSLPKMVCSNAKTGAGCEYRSVNMWEIEGAVRGGLTDLALSYPTFNVDVDQKAAEVRAVEQEISVIVDELLEHGRSRALTAARLDAESRLEKAQTSLREAMSQAAIKQKTKPEALLSLVEAPLEQINSTLRSLYREVLVDIREGGSFTLDWVPAGSP